MLRKKVCKKCKKEIPATTAGEALILGESSGSCSCKSKEIEMIAICCHICGKKPDREIRIIDQLYSLTGMYENVPGLPLKVNICSKKCEQRLNKKIVALFDKVMKKGWIEM